MPEPQVGEKTLPPSPRKLQEAREKGNVAKSQDLSASAALLIALFALMLLGPGLLEAMASVGQFFFAQAHTLPGEPAAMPHLLIRVLAMIAPAIVIFMLFLVVAGVAMNIVQIGVLFTGQAMQPKWERLNPITGFQRFFSARSAVELVKSILKLTIISAVAYYTLRGRWGELLSLMHNGPIEASIATWEIIVDVWWRVALLMLVLGILDFFFQRWQRERDLMMTVQEARQEIKQYEGDPQIKQRIRSIQRQMAQQRMMAAVPEADVVITNPTEYAVALRYEAASMDAPRITAKGAGYVAERIRDIAAESHVPIVQRPEVARALYRIDVGQSVSEELFRAVAEVLAYVYRIDERVERTREREAAVV